MVNAEDLRLVRVTGQFLIQLMSRGEVVAEGFLDDQPLPAGAVAFEQF